jgi:hypothetical protein
MSEEQAYWRTLIDELNERFTLEIIAKRIGVSVRQVTNIKNGDRPTGWTAIKLYLFHMKHRTKVLQTGTAVPFDND